MKLPKFLRKKRNIWIIAILVVVIIIVVLIASRGKTNSSIQIGNVERQNLQETVLATGQVVSETDLDLGFQSSGIVSKVYVKEGDEVKEGQTLATLNQSSALASLTSAQGAFAQAQANYEKLLAGTTSQNISVYEDVVLSAQHDLTSSYDSAVNVLNTSYTKIYDAYGTATTVKNNYFYTFDQESSKVQNSYADLESNMQSVKSYIDITRANASSQNVEIAVSQMVVALNDIYADLAVIRQQCDQGTYYSAVSSADKTSLDTQKGYINTAITNTITAQQSIFSYKIALQKAQHQLDVQKAPPTQAEIDSAQAQILSAQGQVDSVRATLNNLIIRAPSAGTITEVDIKSGEQASALAKAIVLQDINNLHAEANVSEANIASLQVGQQVDYTFDALGPDEHFTGTILSVNPASTVISGVVDYEVKGSLQEIPGIKPGMTVNMTILVAEKENVLVVPSSAIINKNSKKYVRVIDDQKNLTYHEVEIQIGLNGDGGLIEVLSGLSDGQAIVVYMKL